MTLQIELAPEVETALKAKAIEAGEEISAFAAELLAQAVGASAGQIIQRNTSRAHSANAAGVSADEAEDFDSALDQLFSGDSRPLPDVQLKYTREDIYYDHD